MQYKVIDVHTHIWPEKLAERAVNHVGNYYSYEMHGKGTLADLKESTSGAGVEYFVIHSSALKASQVEDVNTTAASHITEKIAGFGTLHPEYADFEKEINRIISLGLKGIKLHPDFQKFNIDDEVAEKFYRAVGSRLPILFHVGDDRYDYSKPHRLVKMAKKYPEVNFIAAHFGGYRCWADSEIYLGLDNVYFDTCSSLPFISTERAKELIDMHGADRFFFATDFPMWDTVAELERFNKIPLTDEEREMIFSKNIKKLLKI